MTANVGRLVLVLVIAYECVVTSKSFSVYVNFVNLN